MWQMADSRTRSYLPASSGTVSMSPGARGDPIGQPALRMCSSVMGRTSARSTISRFQAGRGLGECDRVRPRTAAQVEHVLGAVDSDRLCDGASPAARVVVHGGDERLHRDVSSLRAATVVPAFTASVRVDQLFHRFAMCSWPMRALSGVPSTKKRAATVCW